MLSSSVTANQHLSANELSPYCKWTFLLIIISALARWLAAGNLELGNDEAYYWLYSLHLQWNYFDHPPMVAAWILIFTGNLAFEQEAFVRLGSVTGCALSTWFIYKTAETVHSQKAGWFTACLYNASFYASVTAGIYILPDAPQMVFWTCSLWMIARILSGTRNWPDWIILGIASGLCIMSKVHGVFIWWGLLLYILFRQKSFLKDPRLYVSLLITCIIFSPVIIWNMQNDFITYRFHSNRVSLFSFHWNAHTIFREIGSQLAFNNPVNVILVLWAFFQPAGKLPAAKAFRFIGVSLATVLLLISLTRETLPHWSGPAYVSLLPLAGMALADKNIFFRTPKIIRLSIFIFMMVVITGACLINFYPGTFGIHDPEHLGQGDITLDMYGWKKAGREFAAFYREEINKGTITNDVPVVCSSWSGAHVEYYFAKPAGAQMIALGPVINIHHYFWMNKLRKNQVQMNQVLCIIPSDAKDQNLSSYQTYYRQIDRLKTITIYRNHQPAHNFIVYRLTGFRGMP